MFSCDLHQRDKNFFWCGWPIWIFKSCEPLVNVRGGCMKSAGQSSVAESLRYLFHLSDETPCFGSICLNTILHLLGKSRIFVSPLFEQFLPNPKRFGSCKNCREKGNSSFRIRGVAHL